MVSQRIELDRIIAEIEQRAYRRGWDDAIRHVVNAAKDTLLPNDEARRIVSRKRREGSGQQVLLEIIHECPGLGGVELVAASEQRGTPIKERSLRTSLMRLKRLGEIINHRGKWYIAGQEPKGETVGPTLFAPTGHHHHTSEENDDTAAP
jgi:hypothetical protein